MEGRNLKWLTDQDAGRRVLRMALVAAVIVLSASPAARFVAWLGVPPVPVAAALSGS